MRSASIFVLVLVASAVAGTIAYVAVLFLPDWDDAAGRGLGEAFLALQLAAYVILGIILYGFAAWRLNRERHLKRTLYVLLLAPFLIAVLGIIDNGIRNINWLREAVDTVQMFVPLWAVALVQWLILHTCLSRPTVAAATSSTSTAS